MGTFRDNNGARGGGFSRAGGQRERDDPQGGLSAAQSEFRFVFDKAAIGMALVGFDGSFLTVNQTLCDLVQRTEEELLASDWQTITHPDDVDAGQDLVKNLLAGSIERFQLEKRYLLPNGETVWALLNVSGVRTRTGEPMCLFTQVVDMTEHRKANEARQRFAAIVNSSSDAIVGTSVDGTIVAWNTGAERMLGYDATEIVGRPISTIFPPDRSRDFDLLHSRACEGERIPHVETVCLSKYGACFDVAATLAPVFDKGEGSLGVALVARDITESRWLAATLDSTLGALEQALDEARESEARTRSFLADAAHQLRTPIAGIRACAETLLRGTSPTQTDRLLTNLVRETSRASRLMSSLLRMAHLDQGLTLAPRPSDVIALCKDEADRVRNLAPQLQVAVTAKSMADEQPSVDAMALREIVANLLDNAARYSRERIDIAVTVTDTTVEIRVSDDGPGLPEHLTERAFARFVTLGDKGGSGLGLPIARELARAHGGDLTYESGDFLIRLSRDISGD